MSRDALCQFEDERSFGLCFRVELRSSREIDVLAIDVQRQRYLVGLVPHDVDSAGRHRDDLSHAEYLLANFLQLRTPRAGSVVDALEELVHFRSVDTRYQCPGAVLVRRGAPAGQPADGKN